MAEVLGAELGQRLLAAGGREILAQLAQPRRDGRVA
jgi:hypothetical protein